MDKEFFYTIIDIDDRKLGVSYDTWKSPLTFWRKDCGVDDLFRLNNPWGWSEEVRREKLFEHKNMVLKETKISHVKISFTLFGMKIKKRCLSYTCTCRCSFLKILLTNN